MRSCVIAQKDTKQVSNAHSRVCPKIAWYYAQSPSPHRESKALCPWVYVQGNRSALHSSAYVCSARSYHPSSSLLAWTSAHALRNLKRRETIVSVHWHDCLQYAVSSCVPASAQNVCKDDSLSSVCTDATDCNDDRIR